MKIVIMRIILAAAVMMMAIGLLMTTIGTIMKH